MKKVVYGILILLASCGFMNHVKAGSLNVYASSTSPIVGSNVIITIQASDIAGQFAITSSNGSILSGGTSSVWIENETKTFTFKTNAVGTATVSVVPIDAADFSTNSKYTTTRTVQITVKSQPIVVLSSNNYLSSLGVEGVGISPEFNRDTLEYTVEMEPGTTRVNLVGSVEDGTARVEGFGEREVNEGANRFEINVIAQNGNVRTYVVVVNVKEYNPIPAEVDGKSYTVVRKRTELEPPTNYTETTVPMGDEEVPAYYSEITEYTLVGLKDEEGKIGLYIYDSVNGSYTKYQEYTFGGIILYPMELKEIPSRYKKTVIILNDEEVPAYKIKKSSSHALLYGMNVETGKMHLYLYDKEENTLQIYYTDEIKLLEEKNELYLMIGLILGGISFLLLIILIIVLCRKGKKDSKDIISIEETKARHKKKKKKEKVEVTEVPSE